MFEDYREGYFDCREGLIAHQANCRGSMGKGLALQIKNTYPSVYHEYRRDYFRKKLVLGEITYTKIFEGLYIVNLMGQDHYRGKPPLTNYGALTFCLGKLGMLSESLRLPVYVPYNLGCGLAGGDWEVVSELIEKILPDCTICKLPE